MHAECVGRERWDSFLRQFSRQHARCPVTVEVVQSNGPQPETSGVLLDAIDYEPALDLLRIHFRTGVTADLSHVIQGPREIWFERGDGAGTYALDIVSDDCATVVRFDGLG